MAVNMPYPDLLAVGFQDAVEVGWIEINYDGYGQRLLPSQNAEVETITAEWRGLSVAEKDGVINALRGSFTSYIAYGGKKYFVQRYSTEFSGYLTFTVSAQLKQAFDL